MEEEKKKFIIGDFEYSLDNEVDLRVEAYVGQTGAGSIAVIPKSVNVDGEIKETWKSSYTKAMANQSIEKLILIGRKYTTLEDLPILKEIEIESDDLYEVSINNCPELQTVVVKSKIEEPVRFKDTLNHPIKIQYNQGVSRAEARWGGEELKLSGDNLHIVFGDEVEDVGIIRGGHVTLGKGLKNIKALKKADLGLRADTTVAEYELPTRIDFLSDVPPVVGSVAPGAMTLAELHVPKGSLEAYMNHPQWGKAAYFVEEGGKTVDKYAAKHKARLKKIQTEREKSEAEAAEKAKKEKVEAMGGIMHSTLATQRLAKWNPKLKEDYYYNGLLYNLEVGPLVLTLGISKSSSIDIWDKIVEKLESVEQELK